MNNEVLNTLLGRLLSFLNSNPYSQTYGCFDRDFWHYKTLRDFPSAPYQQGVLSLAWAYKNNFDGNKFYKNKKILELVKAGISYWASIQNRDGSFNEWFPGEHSQVATAFTTCAVTETALLLEEEKVVSKRALAGIKKAGDWLCKNPDPLVTNHTAGSLVALYNIYLLTKDEKYLKGAKDHLSVVLKNQDKEGWFLEYDGCDQGYLSVTVDFLREYYEKSKDEKIFSVIKKAEDFMAHFVHPDGTYGGEYGSRNTKYLFGNISAETIFSSDDRYFAFFFFPNFLKKYLTQSFKEKPGRSPVFFEKNFSGAGIFTKKNEKYHIILNYKKGGTVKIFSVADKKLVYADTGYVLKTRNGILYSQNQKGNAEFNIEKKDGSLEISLGQKFSLFNESYPLKKLLVPFRVFNYTFGRSGKFMSFFNKKMKERMILKEKLANIKLKRLFKITEEKIEIKDEIANNLGEEILSQKKVNNISFRHVPSSKFFRANDFFFTPENSTEVTINF